MARFGRSFPIRPWIRKTLASVFTTILPAAAAIALSGSAPSVSQNFQFTPSAGSLAVSGAAPTAQQNAQFAPGAASLALSGVAPTAQQNAKPLPSAGSLSLTGVVPGATLSSNFSPGAGSLVSTGAAPTAQQTTQASPAAAALTLAGVAPAAQQNAQPSPGAAAMTLSGAAPSAQQNAQFAPGAASLALSGVAPTAQQNTKPLPGAGSLSLAGVAPAETLSSNFSPVAASLALSGVAPTVQSAGQTNPDAAALTLTGQAPTLTLPQGASPGSAALALTGAAPSAQQNAQSIPAPASLALSGIAPTAQQNAKPLPSAGSLSLSGVAPAVQQAAQAVPAAASLAVTGAAPTVQLQSRGLAPSAAALTLIGAVPSVTLQNLNDDSTRTDWPAEALGNLFLVDGYNTARKATGVVRNDMESGFARARVVDLNPLRSVTATLVLNYHQMEFFSSWLEYRSRYGEKWFFVDLPIEGDARNVQARIVGSPSQQPMSALADHWTVSLNLEVFDQNTVSRTSFDLANTDTGTFPSLILGDAILLDGYANQRQSAGSLSDQEGVPHFRLQTLTPFRDVNVVWNFTASQLAYFNAWIEYRARYEAAFFDISLPIESGEYRSVKARFAAPPVATNLAPDIWRCSASLEVRDISRLTPEAFEFYELLGDDLFSMVDTIKDLTLEPFFEAWAAAF